MKVWQRISRLFYFEAFLIFIPKLKSYRIIDIIKSINPNGKIKVIGIREGEKLDEELISSHDSHDLYDVGEYYVYCSFNPFKKNYLKYRKVKEGFNYNSRDNDFYSIKDLKKLLKKRKIFIFDNLPNI